MFEFLPQIVTDMSAEAGISILVDTEKLIGQGTQHRVMSDFALV